MNEEKSYGVILVFSKDNEENRFLIIQHTEGHWGFPKGHMEEGETVRQAQLRELREETGITEIEISEVPSIFEEYIYERNGQKYHKTNEYVIGFVSNDKVTIQEKELNSYKWATFEEAISTFTYGGPKKVLETAQKYLKNMVK